MRSVPPAELAVVPGEGFVRRDLEDDALRGAAHGPGRTFGGAAFAEPGQHLGNRHRVVNDLAFAADHDAFQLGIGAAALDHDADPGVAADVHDLLRLAV